MRNLDENVVKDFGDEWKEYNQRCIKNEELEIIFDNYFEIFPFHLVGKKS